ncbi:MAG: hypothetical protein INQ03_02830 [Candidatus Heimdallarchaeota archaeon]|nr:hypothetical protein [Candidatus Heimdallarchaeota archaeon]
MTSIAMATREIIKIKPFIEDFLGRNLINYNSLAQDILPDVEKRVGEKVKVASVAMALRRIGEKYQEEYDSKISKKLKEFVGSSMTIRLHLFEITVRLDQPFTDIVSAINNVVSKNDYLSIIKGNAEMSIITSSKHKERIIEICKPATIINISDDLAAIFINIPEDSSITPGLFYYFSKALTIEGINISELVSTFSEMQFILEDKFISDASRIITDLIKYTEVE